jgi:hypothetical protein
MARKIEMIMVEKNIRCLVELLEQEAPNTCQAVLDFLPQELDFINAQGSGDEAMAYLDPPNIIRLEPENLERNMLPGDVCYYYAPGPIEPRSSPVSTSTTDFAEFVYVYGRGCRYRDWIMNLFGVMTEGKEEFCAASHSICPEGPIRILMREVKE